MGPFRHDTRWCTLLVCVAALLAACIVSGCEEGSGGRAPGSSAERGASPAAPDVRATYHYTAELAYYDIRMTGSRLTAVYLPTTFKPDPSMPPIQRPHYDSSDLKHAETRLTNHEIQQFVQLVKSSGFLGLKSPFGAPDNVRYYATTISVEMSGKTKTVTHRSNPQYSPAPEAFRSFRKVQDWLMRTAGSKFEDFPTRW